jgi:hypothetical protein
LAFIDIAVEKVIERIDANKALFAIGISSNENILAMRFRFSLTIAIRRLTLLAPE